MTLIHSNIIKAPIDDNIKKLLSIESKSCKLVRLTMVREVIGGKLWRDPKIRKALHK